MSGNIKLESFNRLTVKLGYEDIIDKYADDCAKYLVRTSPKGHRRSKTYAQGWTYGVVKSKKEYGAIVHNATNYQLTHLLEHGHIIANKKGGVGWASPRPHIENAFQHVKEPFIRAMENVKIDTEIT